MSEVAQPCRSHTDAYTIIRRDVIEFTPPSACEQSRGVMRRTGSLFHSRATAWW